MLPAARAEENESSLVERARRGDVDAASDLFRRYDDGLRALAYRLLGDRDRMDDALQDAYVKAFRALPRFEGRASFGTWLYRIVYNVCVDELARVHRPTVPLDEAFEWVDPAPGAADVLPERHRLADALGALAPEERAAVLLVDAQGFDYADAAVVLGVPEGTVASRLSRARASLRKALEEGA